MSGGKLGATPSRQLIGPCAATRPQQPLFKLPATLLSMPLDSRGGTNVGWWKRNLDQEYPFYFVNFCLSMTSSCIPGNG